jgi:hypothetical protein
MDSRFLRGIDTARLWMLIVLLDLVRKIGEKKRFTVFRTRTRVLIYGIDKLHGKNRSGRGKLYVRKKFEV